MVSAVTTQTTITISWSFTSILDSRNETFIVMYGTTPGALSVASNAVSSRSDPTMQDYSVQIMPLLPGTSYYYQIHSTNRFTIVIDDMERMIRTMDASEFICTLFWSDLM